MPWPSKIATLFELATVDGERDESEWYGPYNALLNYLFPVEEDYVIVLQYKRPEQLKSVDFTTIFVVRRAKYPVFFLEIKATGHIHKPSQRAAADLQIQDQFFNLFDEVQIPIFYGLSALGPRVSVYTFTKSTNEPETDSRMWRQQTGGIST
ncbi:hypothetical protein EV426DRAFT_591821 [Tirmania nivea]|nr:hypothetical protein EV426DRAFT_591821 [Tirmania nivea]